MSAVAWWSWGIFIRSLDRGRVFSPSMSWWLPPETGSHSQDYCVRKVGSFKMESGPGKKTLRLRWGRGLREWGLCFLTDPPPQKMSKTWEPLEGAWLRWDCTPLLGEAWWHHSSSRHCVSVPVVFPPGSVTPAGTSSQVS